MLLFSLRCSPKSEANPETKSERNKRFDIAFARFQRDKAFHRIVPVKGEVTVLFGWNAMTEVYQGQNETRAARVIGLTIDRWLSENDIEWGLKVFKPSPTTFP